MSQNGKRPDVILVIQSCRKKRKLCVRLWLERGANAEAKDKAGNTPLHLATTGVILGANRGRASAARPWRDRRKDPGRRGENRGRVS
jgi:hypothetical protein